MKKQHIQLTVLSALLILLSVSCKKGGSDPASSSTPQVQYDRTAFLNNMGKNVIIPRYFDLKEKMVALTASSTAFTNAPSTTTLATAQTDFITAYKCWQRVSQFAFGPADVNGLVIVKVNAFPTNASTIESNITSGTYDFTTETSSGFKGFPALDYLLFSRTLTNQQIADAYANSANRKQYLTDVVTNLSQVVNTTYNQWISGTNYISIFEALSGNDVSSSTSALLNQMALEVDNFKNYKLGIPLGAYNNIGSAPAYNTSNPAESEGYYSDSSLTLMKTSMISIRDFYIGKTFTGIDSTGFDDYLIATGHAPLNTSIINEFNTIIGKIDLIQETYSQSISDPAKKIAAENAFSEITLLLRYIKVDLSTAINVQITFSDNDGD
jgi:predicted lipoprotein